jgi:catechol 2,3-dioxygenase-like lactoylglutathione lyase family enzyme
MPSLAGRVALVTGANQGIRLATAMALSEMGLQTERMRARINHVSVGARELGPSVRFYTELFGAEEIDTPNFGYPVQWLRLGDLQIHLFRRSAAAPTYHHFAIEVDDFETAFRKTREAHDRNTMGAHLNELPTGQIQLYLRDPGGNLVEINCADAGALSEETRAELVRLRDRYPQDASNSKAHLDLALHARDRVAKRSR